MCTGTYLYMTMTCRYISVHTSTYQYIPARRVGERVKRAQARPFSFLMIIITSPDNIPKIGLKVYRYIVLSDGDTTMSHMRRDQGNEPVSKEGLQIKRRTVLHDNIMISNTTQDLDLLQIQAGLTSAHANITSLWPTLALTSAGTLLASDSVNQKSWILFSKKL
jgi:hypothetical protein